MARTRTMAFAPMNAQQRHAPAATSMRYRFLSRRAYRVPAYALAPLCRALPTTSYLPSRSSFHRRVRCGSALHTFSTLPRMTAGRWPLYGSLTRKNSHAYLRHARAERSLAYRASLTPTCAVAGEHQQRNLLRAAHSNSALYRAFMPSACSYGAHSFSART